MEPPLMSSRVNLLNYSQFIISATKMNGNAQTNKTVLDKYLKLDQRAR